MTWVFWLPILYLMIGIPFGVYEARRGLARDLRNVNSGWYKGDGSGRRSEEQRIRFLASQNFWPGIGSGMLWPAMLIGYAIEKLYDGAAGIIASKEIKEARRRANEAKTQAILDSLRKEDEERFKDL